MEAARVGPWLLVADQQAFEERELGTVYRDANWIYIIKGGTLTPPEFVQTMVICNFREALSVSKFGTDTMQDQSTGPQAGSSSGCCLQ